jgi:hypothetical protein
MSFHFYINLKSCGSGLFLSAATDETIFKMKKSGLKCVCPG